MAKVGASMSGLVVVLGMAWSLAAAAQVEVGGSLYGLYEGATGVGDASDELPAFTGYGDLLAELRISDAADDFQFALRAHTDTLEAGASFGFGRWFVEPGLRMQRRYALLQYQRYVLGELRDGYHAGYIAPRFGVGVRPGDGHTVRAGVAYRRWVFDPIEGTVAGGAPPYRDPVDVFEARLSYTWWSVRDDPSMSSPAHHTPRVVGLTTTIELGLDVRADVEQRTTVRLPDTPYLDGGPLIALEGPRTVRPTTVETIRQELHWGQTIGGPVRFQLSEWAGWGNDEDALTYARIGGSWSQYFVPLVGQPWGAVLASRYLVAEPALVVGVGRDHELAAFVDVAHVDALLRSTSDSAFEAGTLWGLGVRADLRFNNVQVDLRVGHSPSPDEWIDQRHWTAAIGFGFDAR